MDIKDKVIVVTGASQGLGKELAIFLAQKEHVKLAVVARNENELLHVKREIIDSGSECEMFICDVTKLDQIQKTSSEIIQKFGRVDILINNAGIWRGEKFDQEPYENIFNMFATNTLGPIYFCREFLPIMEKQNTGEILNITSIAGIETPPSGSNYAVYTASKHALRGFTDSLEKELKDTKIKVMGFYPGGMKTNIMKAAGYDGPVDPKMVMDPKDIVKILHFMITQPEDVLIDHLVVRKLGQTS